MKMFDADIPLNDNDDVGNNWRRINDDELLSGLFNKVPTTNAGELSCIVEKETQYGVTFGNIKIYGNVLLNQCGALLTRNNYEIKGSRLHDLFLQMICVTIFIINPAGVSRRDFVSIDSLEDGT